jgi:hypothetical protein
LKFIRTLLEETTVTQPTDYERKLRVELCRLALPYSSTDSICGLPYRHDGDCGEPITSTPQTPERRRYCRYCGDVISSTLPIVMCPDCRAAVDKLDPDAQRRVARYVTERYDRPEVPQRKDET